jgi:hypothetical protein
MQVLLVLQEFATPTTNHVEKTKIELTCRVWKKFSFEVWIFLKLSSWPAEIRPLGLQQLYEIFWTCAQASIRNSVEKGRSSGPTQADWPGYRPPSHN